MENNPEMKEPDEGVKTTQKTTKDAPAKRLSARLCMIITAILALGSVGFVSGAFSLAPYVLPLLTGAIPALISIPCEHPLPGTFLTIVFYLAMVFAFAERVPYETRMKIAVGFEALCLFWVIVGWINIVLFQQVLEGSVPISAVQALIVFLSTTAFCVCATFHATNKSRADKSRIELLAAFLLGMVVLQTFALLIVTVISVFIHGPVTAPDRQASALELTNPFYEEVEKCSKQRDYFAAHPDCVNKVIRVEDLNRR